MCNLIYSNSFKILSSHFLSNLKSGGRPKLHSQLVVYPNETVKQYLIQMVTLSKGICFGIKWLSLENCIKELLDLGSFSFPDKDALSFALLASMQKEKTEDHLTRKAFLLAEKFHKTLPYSPTEEDERWKEIFKEKNFISPLTAGVRIKESHFEKVHLFGFPFIPNSYLQLLLQLSSKLYLYQFSPCRYFWEDLLSDREISYSRRLFKKKKLSSLSVERWEELSKERNPLLPSLGKMGREMLFFYPENRIEKEEYTTFAPTLLGCLQNDILVAAIPKKRNLLKDDSILKIPCDNAKYKEVERLQLLLKKAFSDDPTLCFSDVRVYAPNIEEYQPLIDWIIEFPHMIYDLPEHSLLTDGLSALLQLVDDPFKLENLYAVFSSKAFLQKHHLNYMDLEKIRELFTHLQIKCAFTEKGYAFSLEEGLKRVVRAITYFDERGINLEMSESKTLDLILRSIDNIERISLLLSPNKYYSFEEWQKEFKEVIEEIFSIDTKDLVLFGQILQSISSLKEQFPAEEFSGEAFSLWLQKKISSLYSAKSFNDVNQISFYSIRQTILPAKIIALIGMDEESFPRKEKISYPKTVDYLPLVGDQDRYFFLQAIFAAEEKLWTFHQNYSAEDGKEQFPSPICQQLFSYLDEYYRIEGKLPSDQLTKSFPNSLYHPDFFSSSYSELSPSSNYYKASLQKVKREEVKKRIIPISLDFYPEKVVPLSLLTKAAKSPIQLFLNERKIFFPFDVKDSDPFILSPYTSKKFLLESLFEGKEDWKKWTNSGEFPEGRFASVAINKLQKELSKYRRYLSGWQIQEVISFSFHEKVKEDLEVIGDLEMVHKNGFLVYGKSGIEQAFKSWPSYLLYRLIFPDYSPTMLFLKDGRSKEIDLQDEKEALSRFLLFVKGSQLGLCPFTPNTLVSFMKGKEFSQDKDNEVDLYTSWLFSIQEIEITETSLWRERFRWIFEPLWESYGI